MPLSRRLPVVLRRSPFSVAALAALAALALVPEAHAQRASFGGLGAFPHTPSYSAAAAVSADGSVVTGRSFRAGGLEAFRWVEATGLVGLGDLPGGDHHSEASGVSADGSTVVGRATSDAGIEAFRWTAATGLVGLGDLPGTEHHSEAFGVSADGRVVVGAASGGEGSSAFRWTAAGGMVALDALPGPAPSHSLARAVSADGAVVAGYSSTHAGLGAFRWTAAGGVAPIEGATQAHGVSVDGRVIVGGPTAGNVPEAFRWTAGGGTVGLGDLPGGPAFSQALGVSGDGSIVVGFSYDGAGESAFIWTQAEGMRPLKTVLEEEGVDLSGWRLSVATAVSEDGTAVVGYGTNPQGAVEAWRAVLPGLHLDDPGALVVGGEPFRIRWSAPSSLAHVDLVLLPDTLGAAPLTVRNGVTASDTAFVWAVPDTLFSRSARLVIRDVLDPARADTSGYFRLKPYHLTRLVAVGARYEPFRPDLHGWPYPNTRPHLFPPEWVVLPQFDYEDGTDPFTQRAYDDDFPAPPLNARPDVFADWPAYVRAYGTDDAYHLLIPFVAGVYRGAFTAAWGAFHGGRRWGGSCSGMAVSSLLAFGHRDAFGARYPDVGPVERLFTVGMSPPVREMVNALFAYWGGTTQRTHRAAIAAWSRTPQQTLADLKAMLLSESRAADGYLYIASSVAGGGAHAVVPYGLRRDPSGAGRWRLRVYDPNRPADSTAVVLLDSLANQWSYAGGLNWSGSTGMYVMDPAPNYLAEAGVPAPLPLDAPPAAGDTPLYVAATPGADVRLASAAGAVGYAAGAVFNTLPDAVPDVPPVGGPTPPVGYEVPAGAYTLTLAALPDSTASAYVFAPGAVYAYGRADAEPAHTDRLAYDPAAGIGGGLSAASPDAGVTKTVALRAVLTAGPERTIDAADLVLIGADSVAFAAVGGPTGPRLRLANRGGAKTYTLRLRQADASGAVTFRHVGVPLADGATHVVRPVWAALATEPVEVEVDLDGDGAPDEVLTLANQPVAAEPEAPAAGPAVAFALHAPAPNPASGPVRFAFDVPAAGRVRLALYDALGREVAVVADEYRAAGAAAAPFDAGRLAPGVYLARLTAGGAVETRPLVIAR